MGHVAIYARTSTYLQSTGLEAQLLALKNFCESKGLTDFKIFADEGISGTKHSRPQLDLLMQEVRSGKVESVVVYSFSRFARSTKHLLEALETFNQHNVSFVSISENLDTKTSTGRFVFTILAALSALEREILVERVKTGLVNARSKGKRLGRPKQHNKADLILHLASQNLSYREISKLSGVSPATVCRELRSRVSKTVA